MSSPLSPDQWQQLESLVDALLDTPPERRAALFAEVSGGDPARREELERLVAACERTYPLLDQTAAERFAALVDTAPLQPAQVVAERYRITRELGRGGMATVYLAHDLKHSRDVALKVVRPELVATVGSGRFLREIEIAAQLRHPNIVPLYDSGQVAAGQPDAEGRAGDGPPLLYYVMPYESGQSLREKLRRDGPLSVDDALVVLRDVCEALTFAHQRGIVHRDIKPDNVLLAGRRALVTDFGVARAATEATGTATSTGAGVMIGTPAYMAPEQIAADPRVDHRADIYAVGVLAYEILTGRQPLGGDSPQDILAAHLTKTPDPISTHRPDVPAGLADLVMKCLEKRAADRWQSADEIIRALETATGPTAFAAVHGARRPWLVPVAIVAVIAGIAAVGLTQAMRGRRASIDPSVPRLAIGILPVRASSPGGDLNWLATGLESQLSVQLAEVPAFELRPPTETIDALIRSGWPLDSIALAREVDYFVRAAPSNGASDSVIVALELIERGIRLVRAGFVRVSRVDATPEVIGRRVSERLRPMLGSRAREKELESGSTNMLALQHRRRADHHRLLARERVSGQDYSGAEHALDSARTHLLESERLDPKWSAPRLARASLGATRALVVLGKSDGTDTAGVRRAFAGGLALLDSIIRETPRNAVALALRGRLRWQQTPLIEPSPNDVTDAAGLAKRDLEAALAIDSTLVQAAADLSQIYFEAYAQYEEAVAYAALAHRIDAYMEGASQIVNRLALGNLELNRDAEAVRWCREGIRRFPTNPAHTACVLDVMAWGTGLADSDSAWAYYRDVQRLTGPSNLHATAFYGAEVAAVLARTRNVSPDSARDVLARVVADISNRSEVPQSLRDDLLALQAAVLYRLGDSTRASQFFAQLRQRDAHKAGTMGQRRMLRGYVSPTASPSNR